MKGFHVQILLLVLVSLIAATPLEASCPYGKVCTLDTLRSEKYIKGLEAYKACDYDTAVRLWKAAAKSGDASAQCNLGACYYSGKGVGQSYNKAIKWFRKSAAQGNDMAQCNIGNC